MVRLVSKVGSVTPPIDIGSKLTFNFDASTGTGLDLFQLNNFQWNYRADENNSQLLGSVKTQLRNKNGLWQDVWQEPLGIVQQVTINRELQYYVHDHVAESYNLPPLKEIINGELNMYCRQTPDNMKDLAKTAADTFGDFTITNVDQNTNKITVSGIRYERKRPADDNSYAIGSYMGFERFLRDELINDPSLDSSWKRRKYDYGWVRLQPAAGFQFSKLLKYTLVEDSTNVDPPYYSQSQVEQGIGTNVATTHTLTIEAGQLNNEDWARIATSGGVLKLYRRLPWIAPMLSTAGNFSQKYFISETVMKLDNHAEQFFAIFGWGNVLKIYGSDNFNGSDGKSLYGFNDKYTNATELDFIEWPGGGDIYRKYHNIHAAGIGGMLDYANQNGILPVMPEFANEWAKEYQSDHVINIARAALGFVDYGEYFKLRVEWLPPYHVRNPRKVGIVQWHVGPENGPMHFLCGTITPPWWDENPGIAKHLLLCNAVGGNFVNLNEFSSSVGQGSTKRTDVIVNKIKSMQVWQVAGQTAGGAGYPDMDGNFSRGFAPSIGDTTGNSGSGIVSIVSPPAPDPDIFIPPTTNKDTLPVNPTNNRIRILLNATRVNTSINAQNLSTLVSTEVDAKFANYAVIESTDFVFNRDAYPVGFIPSEILNQVHRNAGDTVHGIFNNMDVYYTKSTAASIAAGNPAWTEKRVPKSTSAALPLISITHTSTPQAQYIETPTVIELAAMAKAVGAVPQSPIRYTTGAGIEIDSLAFDDGNGDIEVLILSPTIRMYEGTNFTALPNNTHFKPESQFYFRNTIENKTYLYTIDASGTYVNEGIFGGVAGVSTNTVTTAQLQVIENRVDLLETEDTRVIWVVTNSTVRDTLILTTYRHQDMRVISMDTHAFNKWNTVTNNWDIETRPYNNNDDFRYISGDTPEPPSSGSVAAYIRGRGIDGAETRPGILENFA